MEDTQLLITFLFNFEIIETVSPQSAVTERMDSENEVEQQHNEKKSQSDKGEQSVEQQNESMRNQKTKDTDNSEDYMRPGEKEERSEEKNQDGIDRANTGKMQMMCLSGETKPCRQITGV